jgi:hypothetical protein
MPTNGKDSILIECGRLPFASAVDVAALTESPDINERNAQGWLAALAREGAVSVTARQEGGTGRKTHRHFLTASGITTLSGMKGSAVETLHSKLPLSLEWQRVLARRIDVVCMVYALARTLRETSMVLRENWGTPGVRFYRTGPYEATIFFQNGYSVGFMRQGVRLNLSDFRRRYFTAAYNNERPSLVAISAADSTAVEYLRRHAGDYTRYYDSIICIEEHLSSPTPLSRIWSIGGGDSRNYTLKEIFASGSIKRKAIPRTLGRDYKRVSQPLDTGALELAQNGLGAPHKRILDKLSDWPMSSRVHLMNMLGLSQRQTDRLLHDLDSSNLLFKTQTEEGITNYALSDEGIRLMCYRDRASVGHVLRRWSSESDKQGRNIRRLRREFNHTQGILDFVSRLSVEHKGRVDAAPPHRAGRAFRAEGKFRSVLPDASLTLWDKGMPNVYVLEFERRAKKSADILAKLHPWLICYDSNAWWQLYGLRATCLVVTSSPALAQTFARAVRELWGERNLKGGSGFRFAATDADTISQRGVMSESWYFPLSLSPANPFVSGAL